MTEQDRGGKPFEVDLQRADDLAAAAIREDAETPPAEIETPRPSRRRIGPIMAVVSLVVLTTQLPALRAAFKVPPSIRVGTAPTDDDTDACIDSLWKISRLLQNRAFRGGEVVEPLTQRPYVVRQTAGDTVVECPNPGAHSLRSLRVSTAHRAPEAKQ